MVKIRNFIDTPSQTAGPFLHIGCTPSITGINIFKDELGSIPFKNISLNEEINIKGKIYDGNNDPIIDAMIETWQCDENGKYFNYQGFSRRVTDFKTGEYQLKTIRPGNQINEDGTISPSYILFWIVARGMNRPLITRMYLSLIHISEPTRP